MFWRRSVDGSMKEGRYGGIFRNVFDDKLFMIDIEICKSDLDLSQIN